MDGIHGIPYSETADRDAFAKLLRFLKRQAAAGVDIRAKYNGAMFYDPATHSVLKASVTKKGAVSADITFGVSMLP